MGTKLYPPQIAGSLPAFCKTYDILQDLSIGARITIPFIMNAGVGEAQVKGFALRLKTASSNTYICPVLYSTDWDKDKSTVTFNLGEEYANALNEGQFYKVQLAYYNYETEAVLNPTTGKYEETVIDQTSSDYFIIGYYSTAGIIKCISKPKISIEGYEYSSVNLFNGSFLGVYDQTESPDKTEKVYSYRFDFYDTEDNLVHTSGELIHNINNDADPNYSTDRYICNDFIKSTDTYKMIYTVTTMNGYVGSSPSYKIVANTRLAPGRFMKVVTTPVVEDGCIDVSCEGELALSPEGKMEEALYYGEFLLSRASEEDGYVEWEQIQEFRLTTQKPSTFHFYDFSVKQGVKYIYGIQQFNMSKLYSTKMLSEPTSVDFEDMFLFDGERSLRIRYNPKVSSFKTTLLEKKVETIGNKYPFVFRNGAVGYKEFPVEGLISYNMDENQRFFKREELYNFYRMNDEFRKKAMEQRYIEYHRNTDLTEANVLLERQFKMAVLDWLNNGEPKLFKSATEGNFIVRLINVNLTPEDILGRMLHTFKANAIEIADCTLTNLKKYGFSIGGAISSFVPLWRTYDFNSLDNSIDGRGKILNFDQEVTSFKIEGVLPRTKVYIYYSDSPIPEEVIIGATGAYSFSESSRRVVKLLFIFENNLNIQGHIECEYIGRRYSNFDAVTNIKLQTLISNQVIGINPFMEKLKKCTPDNPAWDLAIRALIETNYKTIFNDYLINAQINESLLDNLYNNYEKNNYASGPKEDWLDLFNRLEINTDNFDPADTIQFIQTDFYNYERNKLKVLNMEQAKLRQRELIPVYVVPYEMVPPEAWDLIPNKVRDFEKDPVTKSFSREDYENYQFLTTNLLFSTTPFGKPYPIDELVTILTLQIKNYEFMTDKHFVYIIYKYDRNTNTWKPIENFSHAAPSFSGSYYDPYYKQLLESYDTKFYINEQYRYDPITKDDVIRNGQYKIWKNNEEFVLTNDILYIKEGKKYIPARDKFNYENRYTFWVNSKEPDIYYVKEKNNIDLSYSKEMTFEQLGEVNKLGISNGIISEQTFQLQITDYYTEVNDRPTAAAKELYQKKYQFLNDVFRMFDNIEQADMKQVKYHSLYKFYRTFIEGAAATYISEDSKIYPLNAYDFLLLYIMLEKEYVPINVLQEYFLPRLSGVEISNYSGIEENLKRLISDYQGTIGVPIEILIEEMFYTEDEYLAEAYSNKKSIYTIIYNQLGKYAELKLIETEEDDLMSMFTNDKITGLDSKNQSLKKMHDMIAAEIDAKKIEAQDLANTFMEIQGNIKAAYDSYNDGIARTAVVEWIKRLVFLNSEFNDSFNLLDFLTTAEQVYTEAAANVDVESQFQQEQIDKWKNYYKTIYNDARELIAENIVFEKIQNDNDDDADLDLYLQKSIDKNLREILILSAQLETIEFTPYNGVPILTDDDKSNYTNKELSMTTADKEKYELIYNREIETTLNTLYEELQALKIDTLQVIDEEQTDLIETIQEFVLYSDIYELFKNYKNFNINNKPVLNIQGAMEWDSIRDLYISKLPVSALLTLERYILKINSDGNSLDGTIIKGALTKNGERLNEEPWYLFSRDNKNEFYNIKEYKNRITILLDFIRLVIKYIDMGINSDSVENVINQIGEMSPYQFKLYHEKIDTAAVNTLNQEIETANYKIKQYIKLLRENDMVTADNNKKWEELIESFNTLYPFDSYIISEPGENSSYSNVNYQEKVINAKDISTNVVDVCYSIEPELITENAAEEGKTNYYWKNKFIYSTSSIYDENEAYEIKYTFTYPYRYFSDFYWKLIGEINIGADTINTGMLWWYISVVLEGEIEYQKSVLEEMKTLLDEYSLKLSNYNEKKTRYETQYLEAEKIYNQYAIDYPDVMKYYNSNAGDQYVLIDKAIQDVKKYWNLFILELDRGYKREVERGMYG